MSYLIRLLCCATLIGYAVSTRLETIAVTFEVNVHGSDAVNYWMKAASDSVLCNALKGILEEGYRHITDNVCACKEERTEHFQTHMFGSVTIYIRQTQVRFTTQAHWREFLESHIPVIVTRGLIKRQLQLEDHQISLTNVTSKAVEVLLYNTPLITDDEDKVFKMLNNNLTAHRLAAKELWSIFENIGATSYTLDTQWFRLERTGYSGNGHAELRVIMDYQKMVEANLDFCGSVKLKELQQSINVASVGNTQILVPKKFEVKDHHLPVQYPRSATKPNWIVLCDHDKKEYILHVFEVIGRMEGGFQWLYEDEKATYLHSVVNKTWSVLEDLSPRDIRFDDNYSDDNNENLFSLFLYFTPDPHNETMSSGGWREYLMNRLNKIISAKHEDDVYPITKISVNREFLQAYSLCM